ncbi:fasciclin domain-containing protein [Parvularcula sp. LCG005]|uniref:fasciclin domain-containing protein n=1 Tax=Parvularcula sp. LCG005 TaxID=3078805 RepID=UPI002943D5EF|nr:fasciclin domain-containing protein [Parvularcula sp. LCG005]WOI53180.1 fasciclin domain-containing protein [Parvularcula sp. LCG005]
MLKRTLMAAAALTLVTGPAFAADHHKEKKDKMAMSHEKSSTIADKAMATDSLSTLVAAVKAGGLVSTLKGDGPFTVFAPTNDAFAEIQDTVDTLLMPANKSQLKGVLTAHVVDMDLSAADLTMLTAANGGEIKLTTVSGDTLVVTSTDGGLTVTDENGGVADIVTADVEASNGVVHVVDSVLVPAS